MKRNLLIGVVISALAVANLAHANFTFTSVTSGSCESVSGNWEGEGKAYNWFIGDCIYHGKGSISPLDNSGHFTAEVTAYKDSGSVLCPNQATKKLSGFCVNGITIIQTEFGSMNGDFAENSGSANGTLSVAPGMSAEVGIQFHRID